jgi:hypothetical protein
MKDLEEQENEISIKLGNRPPEIFTEDEVKTLISIAEKLHGFCKLQQRTDKEKEKGVNPCDRCMLGGDAKFDLDLCGNVQDLFRTRKEKIKEQIRAMEAAKEQNAKDLLYLTRLLGFIEGKTAEPS